MTSTRTLAAPFGRPYSATKAIDVSGRCHSPPVHSMLYSLSPKALDPEPHMACILFAAPRGASKSGCRVLIGTPSAHVFVRLGANTAPVEADGCCCIMRTALREASCYLSGQNDTEMPWCSIDPAHAMWTFCGRRVEAGIWGARHRGCSTRGVAE